MENPRIVRIEPAVSGRRNTRRLDLPRPGRVLDPLPECVTADNPSRYAASLTSHEYLLQRLREIKLI